MGSRASSRSTPTRSAMRPAAFRRGNERKRQAIGRNTATGRRWRPRPAPRSRASGHAHLLDALGDQRAVLGRQRHHVRHGTQRWRPRSGAPIRGPQTLAQHLHELERHTGTGKLARGTLVVELGVGRRARPAEPGRTARDGPSPRFDPQAPRSDLFAWRRCRYRP